MFKKTIVALAIASASTVAFAAADIETNTTTRTISEEGKASLSLVEAGQIQVDLNAEYAVGDVMTFTFAGSTLSADDTVLPPTLNPTLVDDGDEGTPGDALTIDTMTLGLLNVDVDAGTVKYRVTELTYDGEGSETTVGAAVVFTAGQFVFAGVDTTTTVTYNAKTNDSDAIDTPTGGKGTATIFEVATQFSASVESGDEFSATIDVEDERYSFVGDDSVTGTADDFCITPNNDAVSVEYDATPFNWTYTVYGDFSILDSDTTTEAIELENVNRVVVSNGTLDEVTATSITFTSSSNTAVCLTVDTEGDVPGDAFEPLDTQSFTVDVDVDYTDHGTDSDPTNPGVDEDTMTDVELLSGEDAGAWGINGAVIKVPYMPFGPNTKVIMRSTNTGNQTGDVTVRYMLEGVDTSWNPVSGPVLTAIEPGVTNIREEVITAIIADAGLDADTASGKVAIELTFNAAKNDVTVFAAYNVTTDKDRGFVGTFGALGAAGNIADNITIENGLNP